MVSSPSAGGKGAQTQPPLGQTCQLSKYHFSCFHTNDIFTGSVRDRASFKFSFPWGGRRGRRGCHGVHRPPSRSAERGSCHLGILVLCVLSRCTRVFPWERRYLCDMQAGVCQRSPQCHTLLIVHVTCFSPLLGTCTKQPGV